MYVFHFLVEGFALLACTILLLWIAGILLMRFHNKRIMNNRNAALSHEDIEDYARHIAAGHTVSKRRNLLNWPIPRMNDNYDAILSTYKQLNDYVQKKRLVPDTAEWLLDNFYIIEERVKVIRRDSGRKAYLRLPVLASGSLKGLFRILAIAMDIVSFTDGQIDDAVLVGYLNAYQTHSPLFDREIVAVSTVISLALIERIRQLSKNIKETLVQWQKVDRLVDEWLKKDGPDAEKIIRVYMNGLKTMDKVNPRFIEHLFYRLRRSGRSYAGVQKIVDEQLAKLGTDTAQIIQKEHSAQSKNTVSMGNCITSLRYLSTMDWSVLFEATSFVEEILRKDPSGTYPRMDCATRNYYRNRVEQLASACGVSEFEIAMGAVELAKQAQSSAQPDGCVDTELERTWHIGYYLIGKGQKGLCKRQTSAEKTKHRAKQIVKAHRGAFYFGFIGLIVLFLVGIAIAYAYLVSTTHALLLSTIAGIAVFLPCLEIAVNVVNFIVCKTVRPAVFPKMEFEDGIPPNMGAIVAVPTLLPDEKTVVNNLKNLEGQYLRNREHNLYFALIGAFSDSDSENSNSDGKIIDTALDIVSKLNRKYAATGEDIFYFFHRKSRFNKANNRWFGWERKRGALMEFNDLVLGSKETSFAYQSCTAPPFSNIKYIITLDSDTILPMGMAKKMVETMAHPLNRPVVDTHMGIVVDGYGIMQPRIYIDGESSKGTLFSRIFAGHEGLDPYAHAVSDVYQDMFGEGIYTGKGIYDLRIFQSVLKNAIPDNTVLSHDLLEGSYARVGLVTNLKLIDAYPSHYHSFAARLHRWVRGDWQLLPRLFGKTCNRSRCKINNPITGLSKWKMLDNMRRSLFSPSLIVLVVLSFCVLPGRLAFWLGSIFIAIVCPFMVAVFEYVSSQRYASDRIKRHIPVIVGLKAAFLQALITFVMLPYQAYLMMHAILITLGRVFITRKNMLEWVTSADMEKSQKNTPKSYWSKMWVSVVIALANAVLAFAFKPATAWISLIFLAFWVSAPQIAYWISKKRDDVPLELSYNDIRELRIIARRTWRYFEEFSNPLNHYLAPDNYQVDPPRGVAHRTSPTNIGLGLLAILSARDFGYVHTSNMVALIQEAVDTIESLEKWNGHLYNWYNTYTLKPLRPRYVSTVDSGNFVSYMITLRQGLKEYLAKPLVDHKLLHGIADTLRCAGKGGVEICERYCERQESQEGQSVDLMRWDRVLCVLMGENGISAMRESVWKQKINRMTGMFRQELSLFMPGVQLLNRMPGQLKEDMRVPFAADRDALLGMLKRSVALEDMPRHNANMIASVDNLIQWMCKSGNDSSEGLDWLVELKLALEKASAPIRRLIAKTHGLIERIDVLCEVTAFRPLYVEAKKLFSIGYNIEENKLTDSCYDLLASEARQTSYIAIARGEIQPEHWARMGRALAANDGYKGLISWTGTMFEYLMPLLIMKNYKNTLLDETYSFIVKNQMKYGRQKGTPWGVSESGYNLQDNNHDYQYKAFGVPWLGLKRGLSEDVVIAPYATFLALMVDPREAVRNIGRLMAEGLAGPYGFYEAADYTAGRLPYETKRAIVKSYMAHHQGMSLMALNDCLHQNILQKRFHEDPQINAARLLLQERIPSRLLFTKETKEKVVPFMGPVTKELRPVRRFHRPDPVLPRAHILSNGNYSVMITDRGTGYSRTKMAAVSRWRADSTLDPYGMFFYVRHVNADCFWSATYGPVNRMPKGYEVIFTADKAVFKRIDGHIETMTEVTVADEDSVEIRRISLKNTGDTSCDLEVTSYFEIVLAAQEADIAHPAFGNLFVQTEFVEDMRCLVANRRPRAESEGGLWMANAAVIEGKTLTNIEYETDRMQLMGRGCTAKCPIAMARSKPLSGTVGAVLDPVMSLRCKLRIGPGKTSRISFVVAVRESREQLLSLVDKYSDAESVEKAFQLSLTRSRVEAGYLNLEANEMELYQNMIRDILYISPMRKQHQDMIRQNCMGQSALWRFGISGDVPVVLVNLKNADRMGILFEILKAHEYWRLKDLKVDLVILCEDEYSYELPLFSRVCDIVLSHQTHDITKMPNDVFIMDRNKLTMEDDHLLYAAARIVLWGDGPPMADQMKVNRYEMLPKARRITGVPKTNMRPAGNERELIFQNGLGGFSVDGSEYIIELEQGQHTPAPWVNVIANPLFGFVVSEAGSGYTWGINSHENRLTPWSNDAVSDSPAEALYLCDADTGACWTVTSLPIREDEPYTIRHGFGYSVFEHASHGMEQTLTQYVPVDDSVKISEINLKNVTDQTRCLSLTYYVRPVLGVSDQVTAMHIHTSVNDSGILLVENHYNEAFADKVCFMDVSERERTVTGDRREFFGFGGLEAPDSLKREALSGAVGTGVDPCAAMQVNVTLEPDESRDIVFLLGLANGVQSVDAMARTYRDVGKAKDALAVVKQFWGGKRESVRVDTPADSMDMMLNGWLQYQVISSRLWARSGFYQSGGAFGFRDQLQDCLAIAHIWPDAARAQILLHTRHQFIEGDVLHWWHEPQGKGTRTRFSDDRLWLPYATAEYIRISGDVGILKESIPFLKGDSLREFEDERYMIPSVCGESGTLYDHCIRAVDASLRFGVHGLPLMGSGDWNDGMNAVGNRGRGESVWLGWFLIAVLDGMLPLCMEMEDHEKAHKYIQIRDRIHASMEAHAWDGNWYIRAYFDNGMPLGSAHNTDCKIDSIAQSWAVISGAGDPERTKKAMDSLEDYLVLWEEGLIKLLTPPFDRGDSEPGYIKGYVPGVRENGGQYTHAAAWAVIAFAKMGNGDKAWALFDMINPINHTENLRACLRYKVEPYVIAADVYALHPHTGRGGWTWYTGSAGWVYRAGLEYILGFQKNGDTVVMDPCIPKKWRAYTIRYRYLETKYYIHVTNPDGINKGIRTIIVDGTRIPGHAIDLINDGVTHDVLVVMGTEAVQPV